MAEDVIQEMVRDCMISRARLVSRVLTGVYDEALRPFEIGSAQFALLVAIFHLAPASRAEIGRFTHQDRSTLTRNIQLLLAGWVEEIEHEAGGRSRPLALTTVGKDLLRRITPSWRAAQEKARTVLGDTALAAVKDVANGIMGV